MKKLLLNLLAIVLACTSLKAASNAADTTLPCISAYEPNNTDETAALIPTNTDIQGAIFPSGDNDIYQIDAPANSQIHITLHNPAANTYLGIYNNDTGEYDWALDTGVDVVLNFNTLGGKCYIFVGPYGEPSESCYTLNVGLATPPLCPDTFEYNDVMDSAKTIAIGQTVAGRISDYVDRDFFKFTIDTPSTISAYMTNVGSEYFQFDLKNANGILLRSGVYDATNKTKHISQYGLSAGTYYLETSSQGFINPECYQLTVNTQPSQECADWYEPNNNDLEAPEISINTDYISKLQDQDFYIFFVPSGTNYFEVRVDGLWPNCRVHLTDLYLVGVGFDHVEYNEDYGSVRVFNGGGEYYIVEVDPYTGGTSSDKCYKLRINVPGAAARTTAPITKNELITPVKLYPVPTTGKVFMEINTKGEKEKYITISDLSGRIIFNQKYGVADGLNKLEITLPSTLANGVYILSDGKQSKKILVRR